MNLHPISKYFTVQEAMRSEKAQLLGIDNSIPRDIFPAICGTANSMDALRERLGKPIYVDSWYRCPALNTAVHGQIESQHLIGEAVDWVCPSFGTPVVVARYLYKFVKELKIDQLILEHTWIHTSFKTAIPGSAPRGQILSLLENGRYAKGLTDLRGNSLL